MNSNRPILSRWHLFRPGPLFRLLVAAGVLLATGFPGAVAAQKLENYRIHGFKVGGDFTLANHLGGRTSLAEYRGKAVLLSFGFTNCPDVCPTTMVDFAWVLKALGKKGASARAVFVTVDPEQDTPAHLKAYLGHFHPDIVGLTGSTEEVAKVAALYAAQFHKEKNGSAAGYTMAHTSYIYLIDREGKVGYILPYQVGKKTLLAGMEKLLR